MCRVQYYTGLQASETHLGTHALSLRGALLVCEPGLALP